MTCVADTSWLYALLDGSDAHHAEARKQAGAHDTIFIPVAVLVETLGLIQYRAGDDQKPSVAALNAMTTMPALVLAEPPHDHDVTERIWRAHSGLTYADAAGVAAARGLGVGLCSFDADQLAAHESGRP